MDRFYIIGEAITAPCDIKYRRMVARKTTVRMTGMGGSVHYVLDKVFKGTEGVITEVYTNNKKTRLTVKFSGHRQAVEVTLTGDDHAANPLVSGTGQDPQILNTEPLAGVSDADSLPASASIVLMPTVLGDVALLPSPSGTTSLMSSEADLGPPGPGSELMETDEGAH